MRILGIDQSYTSTGIVVLEGDDVVYAQRYVTDDKRDKPDRALEIAKNILDVIQEHYPAIVALEGLSFGMRGDATRDLAGLQFVIVCMLREHDRDSIIVAPNTVKKVATGNGRADKTEMYDSLPDNVKTLFDDMGLLKTTGRYDLTDAYWIAKTVADPEFKSQGFDKPKKKKRKNKKKK